MYVIRKGRLYVARSGSKSSYTNRLEYARKFPSKAAALADCCPGNESVVDIYDLIPFNN